MQNEKTLNQSIISIRCKLQESNLKKSGVNKFQGFNYFELSDFLPTLNKLMMEEGVNDLFTIEDGSATLKLLKGDEINVYKIPFFKFDAPLNAKGAPTMQDIQYLGGLNTYYKRYLYINAFGITDGDIIDNMDQNEISKPKKQPSIMSGGGAVKKEETGITKSQVETIVKYSKDFNCNADIQEIIKSFNKEKLIQLTAEEAHSLINSLKMSYETF